MNQWRSSEPWPLQQRIVERIEEQQNGGDELKGENDLVDGHGGNSQSERNIAVGLMLGLHWVR
jgi:hypothetical protein